MMRSLNIFLIHSPAAVVRENSMNTTCKILETLCQQVGYKFRVFKVISHETSELKHKAAELEKTIQYTKTDDEEFDRFLHVLNLEQISNILKQKEALKQIANMCKLPTITASDRFMIMEDDALILPEFQENMGALISVLDSDDWDLLMLSLSQPNPAPTPGKNPLIDARPFGKILSGKEAYFIQPTAAKQLYDSFEPTMRFTYRYHLSYWIHTNASIRVKCPTHRVMLEGSKIGFMPSCASDNNLLIYNQEFMEMFKMMINQTPYDFQKIKTHYKIIEHLKSPDAMHLYGVILHREGKLEQAKEIFLEAINEMRAKGGLLSGRSELLNNTINIHGIAQDDLAKIQLQPSKYVSVVF